MSFKHKLSLENMFAPQTDLFLSDDRRTSLSKPLGQLFRGISPEKQIVIILKQKAPPMTITIGDVCTRTVIAAGYYPNVVIVDNQTKRKHFSATDAQNYMNVLRKKYKMIEIENPPAIIRKNAWISVYTVINDVMTNKSQIAIIVKGEEDMITIPCVIEAPLGTIVLYGQPNEGIVMVEVSDETKGLFHSLIDNFTALTSH